MRRAFWLACVLALACGGAEPHDGRPDILLITVDTLRADRLGFAGHGEARTPNLDSLAATGVFFSDAQTPIPRTTQSIASIFTSRHPPEHGVLRLGDVLGDEFVTLAELLRDSGWATAAVSANGVASARQGLGQGFDAFTDSKTLKARYGVAASARPDAPRTGMAEATTREALQLHDSMDAPRFLWAHYMDPHFLYDPPPPFNQVVDWDRFSFYRDRLRVRPVQAGTFFDLHGLVAPALPDLQRLYDAEVSYTDHWIGRLLAEAPPDSLVVFTSDHGESLGEHGYTAEHGDYVYQASMAVPLVFRWPGRIPGGRRVGRSVSTLDVLPTVAALLELTIPGPAPTGEDLSPQLTGAAADAIDERVHFGESGEALLDGNPRRARGGERWRMVRRGPWKLIRIPSPEGVEFELYHLLDDPSETIDRSTDRPEIAAALQVLLEERLRTWRGAAPTADLDPETRSQLRDLGYVE